MMKNDFDSILESCTTLSYQSERQQNKAKGHMMNLTLKTRVPTKWRLIDLETGKVYQPRTTGLFTELTRNDGGWQKTDDIEFRQKG